MLSFARQLPARDSWKICRFSAARPEPRSALEPPGLAPFRRLFRFSASVDHQMTPPWFARLFRASRFRLAHWRSGCRAPLRGPSDLKHHTACGLCAGRGRALEGAPPVAFIRWALRALFYQRQNQTYRNKLRYAWNTYENLITPCRSSSRCRLCPQAGRWLR